MIVKTEAYSREQVGKVVHLRSIVEGLRLGSGVLERLAAEGEKSSLRFISSPISPFTPDPYLPHRYALQLLTPASILATLAGRTQIEVEDIGEMGELFLDAKTSAAIIGQGGFDGGKMW
jgi:RuvB-like protein 1 (pontin 52)